MRRRIASVLSVLAAAALLQGLGCNDTPIWADDDEYYWGDCRYDPYGCDAGDIGWACRDSRDCDTGFCCRDKECGGGMCTYPCRSTADCPGYMDCYHGVCLFTCINDRDCAAGQKCEHRPGVCEWD